jgi:hypothetical protein
MGVLLDRDSVNALKMRLNQDSAGAAEMMEAMMRQIDEGKRDQQYEVDKSVILMTFLRQVSEAVHDVSDNKAIVLDLELDAVPPDEPNEAYRDSEGGMQMMELQRKKREVRRKVLMDKAMKKFAIMCHNRAELIGVEMQKVRASFERLREDLDQAENKIDSDQLHIRTLEAEIAKLRLTVEMGKNNLGKVERALVRVVVVGLRVTRRLMSLCAGVVVLRLETNHGGAQRVHHEVQDPRRRNELPERRAREAARRPEAAHASAVREDEGVAERDQLQRQGVCVSCSGLPQLNQSLSPLTICTCCYLCLSLV